MGHWFDRGTRLGVRPGKFKWEISEKDIANREGGAIRVGVLLFHVESTRHVLLSIEKTLALITEIRYMCR